MDIEAYVGLEFYDSDRKKCVVVYRYITGFHYRREYHHKDLVDIMSISAWRRYSIWNTKGFITCRTR